MRTYDELASWWPWLSAPADYAEEADIYLEVLERAAVRPLKTLLELGSGGGNTASHLKARLTLTLADLAPGMLDVSRRLNPGCTHVQGDMRSLRLGATFDAVLVQDAIMYMTTQADLEAAVATARAHLEPGGLALFVPDDTRETWMPSTSHGGHEGGGRALRYLAWSYDEDPTDGRFTTLYAFLLREEGRPPRALLDEHHLGLFPRAAWLEALRRAGFEPRPLPYRHTSFDPAAGRELFLGVAR